MLLLACAAEPADSSAAEPVELPGHNECLVEGEYTDEVCLAVVEDQGRFPTTSENRTDEEASPDDPRLVDPEFLWVTSETRRCSCRCCHTASLGGAGVHRWDLDFSPAWIDSATTWTLSVFGGWTDEPDQTLPTADLERLQAFIEGERSRRSGE